MASSKWKSRKEIVEKRNGRKLCFWGNSFWVAKTIEEFGLKPSLIVDENYKNQNSEVNGIEVANPVKVLEDVEQYYVVITTASYHSVSERLESSGFVMGEDFACSPILASKNEIEDIKNLDLDVIFSSPDHSVKNSEGGGLFKLNTKSEKITKVYDGKTRGITKFGDKFFVIDMQRGIIALNSNFDELDVIPVKKGSEPHGIAFNSSTNQIFVGQPGRDSVGVYSLEDKNMVREIFLSSKWRYNKKDNHHINDILIRNESLFVSVFSISGNWPNDMYDGGIVEVNLSEEKPSIVPVINGIWMPHSLIDWKSGIVFVESMLGHLTSVGWGCLGKFNGFFLRGLAIDGENFILGVSEQRYPERLKNQTSPISVDAGIIVYNGSSKIYKFIRLKQINSIHSIVIQNGQ